METQSASWLGTALGGKGGNGGAGEPVVLMGGDGRAVERTAAVDDHAVVGLSDVGSHGP